MTRLSSDEAKRFRVGLRQTRARIGRNIQRARMEKRWTIKQLARSVDISYERLDRIEIGKGEAKLFELHRLAFMLDMNLRDFFM